MRQIKWIVPIIAVALAACAQQPTRETSSQREHATIDYAKYVQRTVPWFHFTSLYSWDSHQLGYVVVWTTPRQAYRLALVGPCIGLQNAMAIGLTSRDGMVNPQRDAVLAGGDRCQIMRIEQLNAKAIRAARSETQSKTIDDRHD